MHDQPIFVTRPDLPPLEEFLPYLEKIWKNKWLTNNGPYHEQLERALEDYLGVDHLSLFANGTIALVTALQALHISGEVITTPYSFVATAHSLFWNGITPVFVDVDPTTCNLDPARIEPAITPRTSAILPVHCYGNPCAVERIEEIADRYGLKVIYDAAHAFGVRYRDRSLLRWGDLSVLSFHATKVFNTFEGGAIICPDAKTKRRIDYLKNFGFADEVTVVAPGINGKMNEVCAAFGLLQLSRIDENLNRRRAIAERYRQGLVSLQGITMLDPPADTLTNAAYLPIFVDDRFPVDRDQLYFELKTAGIHGRRYFYPLISDFPMYRGLDSSEHPNLPHALAFSERVICLPIFPALTDQQVDEIVARITALSHGSIRIS